MSRRLSVCGRSLDGGPGTCWFWWEGCPDKVKHCIIRFVREHQEVAGDAEAEAAALAEWERERDKALPPAKLL